MVNVESGQLSGHIVSDVQSYFLDIKETYTKICSGLEQMNNHKTDILNHEKILSVIKELEQNRAITQRDHLWR